MTEIKEIKQILNNMSELLKVSGLNKWAATLEKLENELSQAPDEIKRKILSLYGGMGSLNDIVLYKDGVLLMQENDEFDALRAHLFKLCLEHI